ncbi:MAG: rhodanese-like domain-containing protein [Candidatus Dormibacteria bacterium]
MSLGVLEVVLDQARRRIRRYTPAEAASALGQGALLVDTRPVDQRSRDGEIPGAVVIDRNVLEWRLDPAGDYRIEEMWSADRRVVLICNQGYSSSLAAASLQDIGVHDAGDVIGGFQAWRDAGLPVYPPPVSGR